MNALSVKDLTKRYPAFTLDGICFAVEEGRVCGLVGANGAGKSTTIKAICGLIRSEGSAEIFGIPACELQAKALLGYAGGGLRAYPQKRVKALFQAVSAFYPAWDSARCRYFCERFSLVPEKKISELSEGMKVKLSLTLALSHGARLLILDEPTSGLDPLSREEFCDDILSLVREEGVSVLFSTHITSDLERIADDIVFLSRGKVLANEPLGTLVKRYLLATSSVRETLTGGVGVKEVKGGWEALVPRDDPPRDAALREATLDEIFVHLEYGGREK